MEVKDYSNLIALLIGIGTIITCVIVYCLSQLYFKNCKTQVKKSDNNGDQIP